MKKTMKVLCLTLALTLLTFVFVACEKRLSGTYSNGIGGDNLGGDVAVTFKGDRFTMNASVDVFGVTVGKEFTGTYQINETSDGSQTITLEFDGEIKGMALQFTGTHSFSEGKDENGNKIIKIGLFTLTKQK